MHRTGVMLLSRLPVVVLSGTVLLAPLPAESQPLESFLTPAIRIGNTLVITDAAGAQVVGRLTTLSEREIALATSTGEKRFSTAEVRQLAVRKRHRLLGSIVGAGVGGVLGATVDCGGPENPCDVDLPILLGAGTGLLVGALWQSTVVLYTAPPGGGAVPPQPVVEGRTTLQAPRPPW